MTERRELLVHSDKDALAQETAERFVSVVSEELQQRERVDVALTGGTVGIAVLDAVRELATDLDWSRIHVWWGDERFVPAADAERNALQAREVLLDFVPIPPANVHELPASDEIADVDEAATVASDELATLPDGFQLVFLGMGPDAHVASLFPSHPGTTEQGVRVIPVRNSPKPPPERLSLTFDALGLAKRIWIVVAGEEKASAVSLVLCGAERTEVPAAGAHGTEETLYLVDRSAASRLPDDIVVT